MTSEGRARLARVASRLVGALLFALGVAFQSVTAIDAMGYAFLFAMSFVFSAAACRLFLRDPSRTVRVFALLPAFFALIAIWGGVDSLNRARTEPPARPVSDPFDAAP